MLKLEKIRDEFSIYKNYAHDYGRDLIYLDSASTSLTPDCVVNAMNEYYTHYRSNIERSSFALSIKAGAEVDKVKKQVASFIGAQGEENIVFTSGSTDAANKAIDMLIANLEEGRAFLTSVAEHHSVFVTLEEKCKKARVPLIYTRVGDDGSLDYEALEANVLEKNIGIIFTQLANNVTGQVNDFYKIKNIAEKTGALVVCDASQGVGHVLVSVADLGVDILFFSAHKMCGPTGVGVLYIKEDLLIRLSPSTYGGGAVQKVSEDMIIYQKGSKKFEPGTANIAGIIGLGRAVKFLEEIDVEQVNKYVNELVDYTVKKLKEIDGIKIFTTKGSVGIVSFSVEGIHAHDVEYLLAEAGVATRSGYHCAETFTRHISILPLTRISLYMYNSSEDIDMLILEIKSIIKKFKK